MRLDLLLDIQRKVLGGYINAEEFDINGSSKKILSTNLSEELFNDIIHRAIARACNILKNKSIPITEYTVMDFLNKFNMPNGAHQEAEYLNIMSEFAITPASFNHYISMIVQHKMES